MKIVRKKISCSARKATKKATSTDWEPYASVMDPDAVGYGK